MATIKEMCERASEMARKAKEDQMSLASANGDTDISGVVFGFRGNEPVVTMIPMEMSSDTLLHSAAIAAVAFGCDSLALTTEGYHALAPYYEQSPLTGEMWEHGEMQIAAEEHDAIEKGWLTESLTTMVVNRAGDVYTIISDYKIHRDVVVDRAPNPPKMIYRVEWTETLEQAPDKGAIMGRVPDVLRDAMNKPTLQQVMLSDEDGSIYREFSEYLSPVQMQAHQDCATVKFLPQLGWHGAVMLVADSEERAEVIDRSLGEQGLGGWQ